MVEVAVNENLFTRHFGKKPLFTVMSQLCCNRGREMNQGFVANEQNPEGISGWKITK